MRTFLEETYLAVKPYLIILFFRGVQLLLYQAYNTLPCPSTSANIEHILSTNGLESGPQCNRTLLDLVSTSVSCLASPALDFSVPAQIYPNLPETDSVWPPNWLLYSVLYAGALLILVAFFGCGYWSIHFENATVQNTSRYAHHEDPYNDLEEITHKIFPGHFDGPVQDIPAANYCDPAFRIYKHIILLEAEFSSPLSQSTPIRTDPVPRPPHALDSSRSDPEVSHLFGLTGDLASLVESSPDGDTLELTQSDISCASSLTMADLEDLEKSCKIETHEVQNKYIALLQSINSYPPSSKLPEQDPSEHAVFIDIDLPHDGLEIVDEATLVNPSCTRSSDNIDTEPVVDDVWDPLESVQPQDHDTDTTIFCNSLRPSGSENLTSESSSDPTSALYSASIGQSDAIRNDTGAAEQDFDSDKTDCDTGSVSCVPLTPTPLHLWRECLIYSGDTLDSTDITSLEDIVLSLRGLCVPITSADLRTIGEDDTLIVPSCQYSDRKLLVQNVSLFSRADGLGSLDTRDAGAVIAAPLPEEEPSSSSTYVTQVEGLSPPQDTVVTIQDQDSSFIALSFTGVFSGPVPELRDALSLKKLQTPGDCTRTQSERTTCKEDPKEQTVKSHKVVDGSREFVLPNLNLSSMASGSQPALSSPAICENSGRIRLSNEARIEILNLVLLQNPPMPRNFSTGPVSWSHPNVILPRELHVDISMYNSSTVRLRTQTQARVALGFIRPSFPTGSLRWSGTAASSQLLFPYSAPGGSLFTAHKPASRSISPQQRFCVQNMTSDAQ